MKRGLGLPSKQQGNLEWITDGYSLGVSAGFIQGSIYDRPFFSLF